MLIEDVLSMRSRNAVDRQIRPLDTNLHRPVQLLDNLAFSKLSEIVNKMNNGLLNSGISPEKLVKMLNGEPKSMSNEDAVKLLLFLRKLARIMVIKYLEK